MAGAAAGAVRGHEKPRGLRGLGWRMGRVTQQPLDERARADERALEALGDGRILARRDVDRAPQPASGRV